MLELRIRQAMFCMLMLLRQAGHSLRASAQNKAGNVLHAHAVKAGRPFSACLSSE